jgi:hypothetical protein
MGTIEPTEFDEEILDMDAEREFLEARLEVLREEADAYLRDEEAYLQYLINGYEETHAERDEKWEKRWADATVELLEYYEE